MGKAKEAAIVKAIHSMQENYRKGGATEHILNGFKAIISADPTGIGGAFASLIGDYIPSSKDLRLQQFMEEAAQKLCDLQDQVDETRIKTEHYAYVFEQCLRGASQHPQQEKIDCYKAILVNATLPSEVSDETQVYFLNLVNTLSPVHIRLIATLNEARKIPRGGNTPESGQTLRMRMGNTDGDVLMSAAAELYQLQFTNTEPRSIPFNADLSRVEGRLTPIALKFIEFCTL